MIDSHTAAFRAQKLPHLALSNIIHAFESAYDLLARALLGLLHLGHGICTLQLVAHLGPMEVVLLSLAESHLSFIRRSKHGVTFLFMTSTVLTYTSM